MKKIVLTIIVGIFLLSFTTAAISDLGNFARFDCVDIPQTCPDCTYNNITKITNADSVIVQTEVPMDQDGTYFNYTFCNTTTLGPYIVNGFGDEGGEKDTWEFKFWITETGDEGISVLNNPVLIILSIFGFAFLLIGLKTGTLWFGFMSGTSFSLAGMYSLIYGLNTVTNMYTRGAGVILIGIGLTILLVSAYEGFVDDD